MKKIKIKPSQNLAVKEKSAMDVDQIDKGARTHTQQKQMHQLSSSSTPMIS